MAEKPKQGGTTELQAIGSVKPREISQEMRESYIDYAMSVIVARALPDVRDGLKPVHRRILYVMHEDGLTHGAKFRKSATVVGSTLGRYHPHGDIAVYDAMARMAQDFSMRYPLIEGQGNFGCFTKNTKIRLADGRSISFGDLIQEQKEGKRHWTFSFNTKDKKVEIAEVYTPRLTRKKADLVEVELDNGQKIRCTPDHRFLLRSGVYREAKDLEFGTSLMPLYAKLYDGAVDKDLKGYEQMLHPLRRTWEFVHRLADEWNLAHGIYTQSAGKIRHHKDLNKHNNNPDNIIRLPWAEHWRIHASLASWRHHNDVEYVKKLAEGRRLFIKNNPERISQRISERNRKMWKNPVYRVARIAAVKDLWKDPQYREFMSENSSANLKTLWQRKDFQELMSALKSKQQKERWQNPMYKKKMGQHMARISKKLWKNPAHRAYISELMRMRMSDPAQKARQSKIAKLLWKDLIYRAKFPENHFSTMAKLLWEKEGIRDIHRAKAKKQWEDIVFRKQRIEELRVRGKQLASSDPQYFKKLAGKAANSLRQKWSDPSYKERVVKSKILNFASRLFMQEGFLTPALYDQTRTNNGIPRSEKAVQYFGGFEEMLEEARAYNHKVVRVRRLRHAEDVYDVTVGPWHNFALAAGIFVHNSIDGDPPAAQRYTEARLSRVGEYMLQDINKNTVEFIDNYDGTRTEPAVLPSPLPQLLLNGTLGIAVGMATSIPSHNLTELVDAMLYLIENEKATTEDLFQFVKGPDFPGGGIIYDKKAIIAAYSQGKGPIVVRGKAEIVEDGKGSRSQIVITEIPYQVNKSSLVEQFANLVQEKRIDGIRDIRDESDKDGLRIVFDLQRDAYPQKVLNFLYKFSDLQKTFHLNMLALVDGIQPRTLSLEETLWNFFEHKKQVVERRTRFDLARAKDRAHILEGLLKCLAKIDEVIRLIRASDSREDAQQNLMKRFKLSELQANAILETKLASLAKLERKKIEDEMKELEDKIKELESILASPKKLKEVVKKELVYVRDTFGDERRTKVQAAPLGEIAQEDLVPQEETIITLTQGGYIKRINPATYKLQKRGGKGIMGMKTVAEDIVEHFLYAQTHDQLMVFTDSGKMFQLPVYEIPEGTRVAKGRGLLNFVEISQQDKILSLFATGKKDKEQGVKHLVMITKSGIMKKTSLEEFKNVRKSGLIAISLKKGDELRAVRKTTGEDELIITTKKGQSVRFSEKAVRPMGRSAAGLRGIRLKAGDAVVGADVIPTAQKRAGEKPTYLFVLTENGYGKRTDVKEYRAQSRGGSGVKTVQVTPKTGNLVYAKVLNGIEEDLIVISMKGQVIRTQISSIAKLSRATQGVRIMRLDPGDKVVSAACM